jgi:hypothetical protein
MISFYFPDLKVGAIDVQELKTGAIDFKEFF